MGKDLEEYEYEGIIRVRCKGNIFIPNVIRFVIGYCKAMSGEICFIYQKNRMWAHSWWCQPLPSLPQAIRDFFVVCSRDMC
jgi:hypothetical protein